MNNILQEMLTKYQCETKEDYINAFKEIVQEVALYSLSLTDFYDNAALYGGTALRIFYNLDRFSEDLDFSLCTQNDSFTLEKYFEVLSKNFEILGLNFVPQIKEKTINSNIQSAFLKGNTLEHILLINPKNGIANYIQKNETIKIKFEIDTNPPSGASYDYKYSSLPLPYKIKLYDESSLFAGKVHSILCRNWKTRVKGRDLYDFEFYVKNDCVLNVNHLEKRMKQTRHFQESEKLTLEKVKELLHEKFSEIDFESAKKDVLPFINNSNKLTIWGKEYFDYLVDRLKSSEITIYKCTFDLSEIGIANIISQEEIFKICCPSKTVKDNKRRELYIQFSNYIVTDDSILNFGQKKDKIEIYYIIKGFFDENIYLKNNLDIKKLVSILNS